MKLFQVISFVIFISIFQLYQQQNDIPDWDKQQIGLLLGATFYGVVAIQIIVGLLSDKYGRNKLQMYSQIPFICPFFV